MSRKPYMVQAYLIDPEANTVTAVTYPRNDINAMYDLIKCRTFDAARLADGHVVYVDDEGLLQPQPNFFTIHGYEQPLAGRGLLVGPTDAHGNDTHCRYDAQWFRDHPVKTVLVMTHNGEIVLTTKMELVRNDTKA